MFFLETSLTGDDEARAKARDYVQYVTQQRIGPVHIDLTKQIRQDLTVCIPFAFLSLTHSYSLSHFVFLHISPASSPPQISLFLSASLHVFPFPSFAYPLKVVDVPEDCVGFVMGRGGNTLRSMEEEWGSLMFFAQVSLLRKT